MRTFLNAHSLCSHCFIFESIFCSEQWKKKIESKSNVFGWFSYIVRTIAQLAECVDLESLCIYRDSLKINNYHTVTVMMLHPALITNSRFWIFFYHINIFWYCKESKSLGWRLAGHAGVDRQFSILHNALEWSPPCLNTIRWRCFVCAI